MLLVEKLCCIFQVKIDVEFESFNILNQMIMVVISILRFCIRFLRMWIKVVWMLIFFFFFVGMIMVIFFDVVNVLIGYGFVFYQFLFVVQQVFVCFMGVIFVLILVVIVCWSVGGGIIMRVVVVVVWLVECGIYVERLLKLVFLFKLFKYEVRVLKFWKRLQQKNVVFIVIINMEILIFIYRICL